MGSSFKQRILGSINKASGQTPSGSVNGSNTVFTTASDYASGSLQVYKNGVRMKAGVGNDYTETSANSFTMTTAPATGTVIVVDYLNTATSAGNATTIEGYTPEDLMPIGSVIDYASDTMPSSKWLLAYGQAVSRTTYATLFDRLGTTYGVGDGSTTFNLPDLRGRVSAGQDDMGGTSANRLTNPGSTGGMNGDVLGGTGGQEAHVQTQAELATHTHTQDFHSHTMGSHGTSGAGYGHVDSGSATSSGTFTSNSTQATNQNTGSSTAFNVVQPTIILNKIMKVL